MATKFVRARAGVTDRVSLDVVVAVLAGLANKGMVAAIR